MSRNATGTGASPGYLIGRLRDSPLARIHPSECVEGRFSVVELPLYGVLRSTHSPSPTLVSVQRAQVFDSIRLHLLDDRKTLEFAEPVSLRPQPFDDAR
jgi:hypothetical protein